MMTPTQKVKAARLWHEGLPMKRIVAEVGCTFGELKHATCAHRDMFPRRHRERRGA